MMIITGNNKNNENNNQIMLIKLRMTKVRWNESGTPLDEDEAADLIPTHLVSREDLNAWETGDLDRAGEARSRYLRALRRADGGSFGDLLTFVRS